MPLRNYDEALIVDGRNYLLDPFTPGENLLINSATNVWKK